MDSAATGSRVREARKRAGLTQEELAARSGVSLSLIAKLERGEYGGMRLETVHKLARALRVTTSALTSGTGSPPPAAPAPGDWEAVRRALSGEHGGMPDEAPAIGGMRDAVARANGTLLGSGYAELRVMLPALLRDADALVSASASRGEAHARQVRSDARRVAAYALGEARQFSAAGDAIELAQGDAGDDLTALAAADGKCWLLLRQGRLAECGALAARWADDAEPARLSKASPDELAAWGMFLVRASNVAARDNRPDDAREALRLAKMAAAGVGREIVPYFSPAQVFGPVTVAMIAAEHAMVQDRPDVTLSIGSQVAGRPFPVQPNYLRHRLDVAHAHAVTRHPDRAVRVLAELRRDAPEWLVQQRYARDVLAKVVAGRRTLSKEMRSLAGFLSLPL